MASPWCVRRTVTAGGGGSWGSSQGSGEMGSPSAWGPPDFGILAAAFPIEGRL